MHTRTWILDLLIKLYTTVTGQRREPGHVTHVGLGPGRQLSGWASASPSRTTDKSTRLARRVCSCVGQRPAMAKAQEHAAPVGRVRSPGPRPGFLVCSVPKREIKIWAIFFTITGDCGKVHLSPQCFNEDGFDTSIKKITFYHFQLLTKHNLLPCGFKSDIKWRNTTSTILRSVTSAMRSDIKFYRDLWSPNQPLWLV